MLTAALIDSCVFWGDREMHVIVALVRENQRDIGLVRAVGPWAFAASIVSMIVGAGIFAVPAALAACVGPYGPLAFLACGFAVGAVAILHLSVWRHLCAQAVIGCRPVRTPAPIWMP